MPPPPLSDCKCFSLTDVAALNCLCKARYGHHTGLHSLQLVTNLFMRSKPLQGLYSKNRCDWVYFAFSMPLMLLLPPLSLLFPLLLTLPHYSLYSFPSPISPLPLSSSPYLSILSILSSPLSLFFFPSSLSTLPCLSSSPLLLTYLSINFSLFFPLPSSSSPLPPPPLPSSSPSSPSSLPLPPPSSPFLHKDVYAGGSN